MKKNLILFSLLALLCGTGCGNDDETNNDISTPPVTTVKPVLSKTYEAEIAAKGETVDAAAKLSLVDGNGKALDFKTYRSKVTLTCTGDAEVRIVEEDESQPDKASEPGTKAALVNNTVTIAIEFPANTSETQTKTYTLTAKGTGSESVSIDFVQAAETAETVVVKPVLTKTHEAEIAAGGETVAAAAKLSLRDGDGKALDLASYRSKVSLSCNGNAEPTLGEDGTISIVFPANDSETNTVTYTLTAKGTGTEQASLDFTQAKKIAEEPVPQVLTFVYGNPAASHTFEAAGGEFLNGTIVSLTYGSEDVTERMTAENTRLSVEYEAGTEPWLESAAFENTTNFQWKIVAPLNMAETERHSKVYLYYNDIKSENYVEFIQKAGTGEPYVKPVLTNIYDQQIAVEGGYKTVAELELVDHRGESLDILTYGQYVKLTCSNNTGVDLSGNFISIQFPANETDSFLSYELKVTGTYSTSVSHTFTQAAPESGDNPVDHTFAYTLYNNAVDGSKGTGFGSGAGGVGDWYRFENISVDGTAYTPGDMLKGLVANTELMGQLMSKAFAFGTITADDVQVPGTDPLTENPESFVTLEFWNDGGAAVYVRIVLKANDTGARRTFKIITKDASGTQLSSVVYFQNP